MIRFPSLPKIRFQKTDNRVLDDLQKFVISLAQAVNLHPMRRESTYTFPSPLCGAGAALTARPMFGIAGAARRILSANVVQDNAVAADPANARIYKLQRYRGRVITTVAQSSTADAAVRSFVPYDIKLVGTDLDFKDGDSLALVLDQVGVGKLVNLCAFTVTWESTP